MTWLLLALVLVAAAGASFAVALAARGKREQRDRLEVVPGVATSAPVAWAGAHTPEARLHRRLGDAVRAMRGQPALTASVFADQRTALEQEALRIDARLIAMASLTGQRRTSGLAQVGELVDRYEHAVADLVTASLDDASSLESVISESELRLRALEAARAEVERIDRSGG